MERNRLYDNAGKALSVNGPGCPAHNATRRTALMNDTVVESRMPVLGITDGATGNLAFDLLLVAPAGIVDEVGANERALRR
ncbi:MAG: hypothetical protein U5K81_15950 [Trueperaceae bacterium]|nr:hypothetical protein [Trueperaceae bacterium]